MVSKATRTQQGVNSSSFACAAAGSAGAAAGVGADLRSMRTRVMDEHARFEKWMRSQKGQA